MATRGSERVPGLRAVALLATVLAVGGCAMQQPKPMTTDEQRRDLVLSKLDAATQLAVNAQRELAMTADAQAQNQVVARQRLLTDRVSYDFYGDVEKILGDIAAKYNYDFKVFGKRPPDRVNVNVYVNKMPVLEVLRYIGTTASFWLDVSVKPGVIELTYKSTNS
ncbi:hypothetical protein R70006_04981 [Paraburkholderia domus]|uniref:DotD/TraH family lipoprotein n=1 Tax=Paraburkholderia domus TaxID=2793075 RepID=UPI001912D2DA|nr:DotD/TraH family lipoprotein [Paraburkholderia domus]MBK5051783.1 DotD/TraH family lipoprotein [Burkholderia sp. R-70006]CAE6793948.1 hypothetical protein R70006_04981 [Paraburkholderia domus]